MERREHDIVLDMIANPQMTLSGLVSVGMTPKNTSIQDRDLYESNEWVKDHFKDETGEFDKVKFGKFYEQANAAYNMIANNQYASDIQNSSMFHRDNIFAPANERREGPDFVETKSSNPYQISNNVIQLGTAGDRKNSVDELAQKNKVLLNPTSAGEDLSNAEWGSAPEDSFWKYFDDTLVLAQYDSEGYHIDPISKEKEHHEKGDLKLDDTGNFYYETLDGRDVYERRVLNKMNVLTKEGSWLNQYDFFDSDDLNEKSLAGTIARNATLVGSMFLPYVGPWVTGISIATQLAGMMGTFGKMLVGSDSPNLSALEGWSKSMSRQNLSSEYAQQHPWSWENMINMIGDTAAQLTEQRFIFSKIPSLFTGADLSTKAGRASKALEFEKLQKELDNLQISKWQKLVQDGKMSMAEFVEGSQSLAAVSQLKAVANMESFTKGYNTIGEILGKGYMTMLTTADTYGDAKSAGATDLEATLLTLGHSAGELAILNTGVGEWIMPELREGRYRAEALARALTTLKQEGKTAAEQFANLSLKEGKKAYAKKLFNIGRDIARAEYAVGAKTLKATTAAAAGEAFEEVSEELLADFSKACYDVVKWLGDGDTRINTFGYNFDKGAWDANEVLTRYGLSAIGGFFGGGIANLGANYSNIKGLSTMTSQQAIQELVYMARNGQIDDFVKEVDKMKDLGNPDLSANFDQLDQVLSFKPGTKDLNQNDLVKSAIKQQVSYIKNFLNAEGANVSDHRFLDKQTLGDLRFQALHSSVTAGAFLNEFNTLTSLILQGENKIEDILNKAYDSNKDGVVTDREERKNKLSDEDKKAIKEIEDSLKEPRKQLKDLVEGKRSFEFIKNSLFELTYDLSRRFDVVTFPQYVEQVTGRKFKDVPDAEKDNYVEAYQNWKTSEFRNKLPLISDLYFQMAQQSSNLIKTHVDKYTQTDQSLQAFVHSINQLFEDNVMPEENEQGEWLEAAQTMTSASMVNIANSLIKAFGTEGDVNELNDIINREYVQPEGLEGEDLIKSQREFLKQKQADFKTSMVEILINNVPEYVQNILGQGFANRETKHQVSQLIGYLNREINMLLNVSEDEEAERYLDIKESLNKSVKDINDLSETPFEKNLDEFCIQMGKEEIKISQLHLKLNKLFEDTSANITNFKLAKEVAQELNNAIQTIEMYKAAILGARTDSRAVGLGNLFGYNATLNELDSSSNLAEIDSNVADIFIQDIDTNLNKLKFLQTLYGINESQKLAKQDKISIRKDLINYKRVKALVRDRDKKPIGKWSGIDKLQEALNTADLLEKMDSGEDIVESEENKQKIKEQSIAIENALYEFGQENIFLDDAHTKVNVEKLKELVIPENFQLYTTTGDLLNEETTSFDDNTFLWLLAGRFALKSSDFYFQYKQILMQDGLKKLAPITTQELAVYNNYANIVNGNVFQAFYQAYRETIVADWAASTVDQRIEKALLLGKSNLEANKIAQDDQVPNALQFLNVPAYRNIVLTEGIPGSGKTASVIKQTVELLRKFQPDLLKKVHVIHGANGTITLEDGTTITASEKLLRDCSLDAATSKAMGRIPFMKSINSTWTEYPKNDKGEYVVPDSDWELTAEGEIRCKLGIDEVSDPPSLIIIDEISQFTSYDLDQIQKFAEKYGITVLVAGDFDQSGVVGTHDITDSKGNKARVSLNLDRFMFPRSPKLGVSMRTDNSLKSQNIQMMQAYMQNPKGSLSLSFFKDNTGLYGDRVIKYDIEVNGANVDTSDKQNHVSDVLREVDDMIKTLKPGQKIGYVYSSKSSAIYKALIDDKYSPFIDFKEGSSAQGLEGQYYIIDIDPKNTTEFLRDVYTGVSRAQQGSLIITANFNNIDISEHEKKEKVQESLHDDIISRFTSDYKTRLDNIITEGSVSTIIPREKQEVKTNISTQGAFGTTVEVVTPEKTEEELKQEERTTLLDAIKSATLFDDIFRFVAEANSKFNGLADEAEIKQAVADRISELKGESTFEVKSINDLQNKDQLLSYRQDVLNRMPPIDSDESDSLVHRGDIITFNDSVSGEDFIGVVTNVRKNADTGLTEFVADFVDPNDSEKFVHNNSYQYTDNIKEIYTDTAPLVTPESVTPPGNDSEYEDNTLPIVVNPVTNEEQVKTNIATLNSDDNKHHPAITFVNGKYHIKQTLHTFNSFELGVLVDENNKIIPIDGGRNFSEARIDSVNGLRRLERLKGNNPDNLTLDGCLRTLGRLHSILLSYEDKAKMKDRIENLLGINGIFITFALKSSSRLSLDKKAELSGGDEYLASNPTPLEKSASEKTLFNGSTAENADDYNNKSIVAIIGNSDFGDVIEIPLMITTSPITLMKLLDGDGNPVFKEVWDYWKQLGDITIHEKVESVITKFRNRPEFEELIDLFELYNFTDDGISYYRNPNWTPAKDLVTIGPEFRMARGQWQENYEFEYDEQNQPTDYGIWENVSDIASQPHTRVSQVFVSKIDYNVGEGEALIKASHPFVLYSNDLRLDNDRKLIQTWKAQQEDQTKPQRVKMMYVLPPKVELRHYLENMFIITTTTKETRPNLAPVGNLFTSYHLWEAIINSPRSSEIKALLESKHPGVFDAIATEIEQLSRLNSKEQAVELIKKNRDWTSHGFRKDLSLAGLFDGALTAIVYDRNVLVANALGSSAERVNTFREDSYNLLDSILREQGIDGIFYQIKVGKGAPQVEGFFKPAGTNNWEINGLPFKIHGKIDSVAFQGNISDIIKGFLGLRTVQNGHVQLADSQRYFQHNSNISYNAPAVERKPYQGYVDFIKWKTQSSATSRDGLDFSLEFEQNDIHTALVNIVNKLNSEGKYYAFIIDGESNGQPAELIKISKNTSTVGYDPLLLSINGEPITKLVKNANGKYMCEVTLGNEKGIGEYDETSGVFTITPSAEAGPVQALPDISITELSYDDFRQDAIELLGSKEVNNEPALSYFVGLEELLQLNTFSEFLDAIQRSKQAMSDDSVDITNTIMSSKRMVSALENMNSETGEEAAVKNELIKIYSWVRDSENEQENICKPDIKLSFKN